MNSKNVYKLHTDLETPEKIRDWLSKKIEEDNSIQVLVAISANDRKDPAKEHVWWRASGTFNNIWWLTSLVTRSMQDKFML